MINAWFTDTGTLKKEKKKEDFRNKYVLQHKKSS